MSKIKLSKAQKDVIRRMREGECLEYFWADDAWHLSGFTKNSKTINILIDAGIIIKSGGYNWSDTYELTPLGKQIEL